MNADTEDTVKYCSTCLDFQWAWPKERIIHNEIPGKTWEIIGEDMFFSVKETSSL